MKIELRSIKMFTYGENEKEDPDCEIEKNMFHINKHKTYLKQMPQFFLINTKTWIFYMDFLNVKNLY